MKLVVLTKYFGKLYHVIYANFCLCISGYFNLTNQLPVCITCHPLLIISENQDVNFDAILGELCELETQLGNAQSELTYYGGRGIPNIVRDENRDSGNDLAQNELDALASEITRNLAYNKKRPMGELEYFRTHYPGDLVGYSDAMLDIAETDSAFSESASLPSSESFTSMVTVSSSAETAGMGDASSTGSGSTITPHSLQCDVRIYADIVFS